MKFILAFILSFHISFASAGTLVLGIDLSGSITESNKKLQLESYKRALSDEYFKYALASSNVEIIFYGLNVYHHSSGSLEEAIASFDEVDKITSSVVPYNTCVASFLHYVESRLSEMSGPVVVDISGDGIDNCQNMIGVKDTSDRLEKAGVTINTLPLIPENGIVEEDFFKEYVQTSDGFTIVCTEYAMFYESLLQKLTLEITFLLSKENSKI